jgi:flavin-dependent dehydrogenase
VSAGAQFHAPLAVTELIQVDGRFVGARAKSPTGPVEVRARVVVLATGASIGLLERAGLLAAPPAFGRAARAYYAGLPSLSDAIEFHFDSVPLPGYGWIFPTGPDTANVGAGYMGRANQPPLRNSPRQVFDEFIANPYIARLVAGARRTSPIKGYPLRFDFATARLAFPGLVLVGEAAGLVNPLSGEGIDYALESAEVAAAHIDRAPEDFIRAMRARFQAMFVNITRVRDVYLRPTVLNRFVTAAQRHDELAHLLMHIALGHLDPLRALAPTVLWRVALG